MVTIHTWGYGSVVSTRQRIKKKLNNSQIAKTQKYARCPQTLMLK